LVQSEVIVVKLNINGKNYDVSLPADTPLLWVLRDEIGLTGTKFGCGMALCGACTVHVDGQPARACVTPVSALDGKKVVTIEGIGEDKTGKAVQMAWVSLGVPQCGYCQAGQIMSATALLKQKPVPNDADIDSAMAGNICRCGTYGRIRAAIKQAAADDGATP
jgi:isoquinoline 1-oxidoreductase alpha subunit